MRRKLLAGLVLFLLAHEQAFAGPTAQPGVGVLSSVHDMNVIGSNVGKDELGRVCSFCHTPHHAIDANAEGNTGDYLPLWSHTLTQQSYIQYNSATFNAKENPIPDPLIGPSRVCMSCHDGAIAVDHHYGVLGSLVFKGNEFTGIDSQIAIGAGGALNRSHPIGFKLEDAVIADTKANGKLGFVDGIATTALYLDSSKKISSQLYQGYMTCTTCHDVHNRDNLANTKGTGIDADHQVLMARNYLLFAKQSGSRICLSCHLK